MQISFNHFSSILVDQSISKFTENASATFGPHETKKYISTNFSLLGTDFLPVHVIYRAEVYVVKEKK